MPILIHTTGMTKELQTTAKGKLVDYIAKLLPQKVSVQLVQNCPKKEKKLK